MEWIRTHTHEITEAGRQLVLWSIGLGLITHDFAGRAWTDVHTVLTVSAISAVLATIASKTTVAATKVDERVAEAKAKGIAQGTAVEVARAEGVASGTGTGDGR